MIDTFSFLWITDPWGSLDHSSDTTLRLMQEALALGFRNYWADVNSLRWDKTHVVLDCQLLKGVRKARGKGDFIFSPVETTRLPNFSSIQFRVDPPVDERYKAFLQLLTFGVEATRRLNRYATRPIPIVNPPSALLLSSSKLECLALAKNMPISVISNSWEVLSAFALAKRHTVLKPLNNCQGVGVEILNWDGKRNMLRNKEILHGASLGFTRPVMLQEFLDASYGGCIRFWFMDGDLIGHARRTAGSEHLGQVTNDLVPVETSLAQRAMVPLIGRRLRSLGIRLAAVDAIGNKVIDFNFVSPGLLPQMEVCSNRNLAKGIVMRLARGS